LAPEDGAVVGPNGSLLRWSASLNPDSTIKLVDYRLEIDLESDFSNPVVHEVGRDTSFAVDSAELLDGRLYFWRVLALDSNTEGTYSNESRAFLIDFSAAAPEPSKGIPGGWRLLTPHPNPFNSELRLSLDVQAPTWLEVEVFDLLGRRVASLHRGEAGVGRQLFTWRPDGGSGLYLVRATDSAGISDVRKVVYLR